VFPGAHAYRNATACLGDIKALLGRFRGTTSVSMHFQREGNNLEDETMRKSLLATAFIVVIATPAFADEVGVHVGPVGAGVTVGEGHDHDRDIDRDRTTTVVKEHEPADRTTVIKKEDANGDTSKTIIHHDNN
jgi:hypothetical protein